MESRDDRVRCFDKRTGRQAGGDIRGGVVTSQGVAIERSQAAEWIQIRTARSIFRFDFSPADSPAP
jgi:hypothetical protein